MCLLLFDCYFQNKSKKQMENVCPKKAQETLTIYFVGGGGGARCEGIPVFLASSIYMDVLYESVP